MKLILICDSMNDLSVVLRGNNINFDCYPTVQQAMPFIKKSDGIMLLGDRYPASFTEVSRELWDLAKKTDIKLYVEFPGNLPGIDFGDNEWITWQRGVISSQVFQPDLKELDIISINGCCFRQLFSEVQSHIVLARVAGTDRAVYGLSEKKDSILFQLEDNIFVSTTKLSNFLTGRFGPNLAWRNIITWIVQSVCPGINISRLSWEPSVRPFFDAKGDLPPDFEKQAISNAAQWFFDAKVFVADDWKLQTSPKDRIPENHIQSTESYVGMAPDEHWSIGDGSMGMIEGANMTIDHEGNQFWRFQQRADCIAETAMAMAFCSLKDKQESKKNISRNLNNYLYFNSVFSGGKRADPLSPSYGLLGWMDEPGQSDVYYGDDNARCILGTIASAAVLEDSRWDESLLRCLIANFRTSGKFGFRQARLDEKKLQGNSREYYREDELIDYSPHYQCYLWACYLWAYRFTGYELFFQRAKNAIRMTVEAYSDKWHWTNGLQQERARMLLPLAWLIRVEDKPENRRWLDIIAGDLLEFQDQCGGIYEQIGVEGIGKYGPSKTNEEYGTGEAPLLQENGEPVCDLLYTTNFAFLGLLEASGVDSKYESALSKLAEFICRIQIKSDDHPEFNGGWFRAFNFDKWEYWASNADMGWGAWSIETGWTMGWLTSVLVMYTENKTLWDISADSKIAKKFPELKKIMLD